MALNISKHPRLNKLETPKEVMDVIITGKMSLKEPVISNAQTIGDMALAKLHGKALIPQMAKIVAGVYILNTCFIISP